MSNLINESMPSETYESMLAHGKAKHIPIQAFEVAEFRPRSMNYREVIDSGIIVAAVVGIVVFIVRTYL
jgi:hypothetical protein